MKRIASALMLAMTLFGAASAFSADKPAAAPAAASALPPATPAAAPAATPAPVATPAQDPKVAAMGTAYQHWAAELGYPQFAGGSIGKTGNIYTLKYLPATDTPATAKSMVTITVYQMTGDKEKDDAKMASTISLLHNFYLGPAQVVDDKTMNNTLDEKTWFTQYYTGGNDAAMYTAAAFIRTSPKPAEAAFIQLQSRAIIPAAKALYMYQWVSPEATMPIRRKKDLNANEVPVPAPEPVTHR
jgi:hypothetical protein